METVELRKFSFKAIIVSPQHTTVSTQHTEMAITTDTLYHVLTGQQAYKSTKLVNNCCVPDHAVEKKL